MKSILFAGMVALAGLGQEAQAQSTGTVDFGLGVHAQASDTVSPSAQFGPMASLGVHLFRHFMVEGAASYLPARGDSLNQSLKKAIGVARGVFVLPFGTSSAAMFGVGFARHQFYYPGDTALALVPSSAGRNAVQFMPAVRFGLGNRFGIRVSGVFDHFAVTDSTKPNNWSKGVQVGMSWRFGGHKPAPVVTVFEPAPEAPIVVVEASPLPMPEPEVTPPMVVRLTTVHFAFDRSDLTPIAKKKLREASLQLQNDQGMIVELVGHTDAKGSVSYNQRLSEKRAKSVRDFLVSTGVINERISTRGMGELEPIGDNATAEGRAKNRRVEVNGKPPRKN